MDKLVSILLAMLIGGGLMFAADRAPAFRWDGPIPIVGPHLRYDSLGAKLAAANAKLKVRKEVVVYREKAAAAITATVAKEITDQTTQVRYVTKTLLEKVPIYVTPEADSRCIVPVGAISLLNAAARGEAEVAGPAGGPYEAPSGISLAALTDFGVYNLGVGHELLTEVLGWRRWYTLHRDEWNKPAPVAP